MPRNGSGQYSAPTNSWNPAINSVPATAADWQAVLNDVVSALTQSVSRDGQTAMTGNLPMAGNKVTGLGNATATGDALTFAQLFSQGQQQDVPAAATTDIGAQLSTLINVTGAATITSFGTNYNGPRFLRFAGVCTLTNSASLVVPGGANLTTAAGDSAIVVPLGNPAAGWRVAVYERASGAALNIPTGTILGRSSAGTGDVEALTTVPSGVTVPASAIAGALNASGSAPIYACRAWINFDGTSVAIGTGRGSGNVSSVTDLGTGSYRVNFATAMPDANYSCVASAGRISGSGGAVAELQTTYLAESVVVTTLNTSLAGADSANVNVAVFR